MASPGAEEDTFSIFIVVCATIDIAVPCAFTCLRIVPGVAESIVKLANVPLFASRFPSSSTIKSPFPTSSSAAYILSTHNVFHLKEVLPRSYVLVVVGAKEEATRA